MRPPTCPVSAAPTRLSSPPRPGCSPAPPSTGRPWALALWAVLGCEASGASLRGPWQSRRKARPPCLSVVPFPFAARPRGDEACQVRVSLRPRGSLLPERPQKGLWGHGPGDLAALGHASAAGLRDYLRAQRQREARVWGSAVQWLCEWQQGCGLPPWRAAVPCRA